MSTAINLLKTRSSIRLSRSPEHNWRLKVNKDDLITKNILNLSPTGIAFKAPPKSQFHRGQTLQMKIELDGETEIICQAKVIWIKKGDDSRMIQYGAEFRFDPEQDIGNTITKHLFKAQKLALASKEVVFHKKEKQKRRIKGLGLSLFLLTIVSLLGAFFIYQQLNPDAAFAHKIKTAFSKNQ